MFKSIFNKTILESESGLFYLDKDGMLVDFKPSERNPIIETKKEEPFAFNGFVKERTIKHLIIPKGVKGFADDVIRHIKVEERFELPDGLLYIGNSIHDSSSHGCVFAQCLLPSVSIPESVKELGDFAFGHSRIDYLLIPSTIRSPYRRQFKDSYIDTLCLPKEWENYICLQNYRIENKLLRDNWEEYGYLTFDAGVGNIVFI
ncbi:MAG: leucine-rich repeat protein [Prevotella sp.]|nr:leucine-rich repeat protein [Prevotella sp.]